MELRPQPCACLLSAGGFELQALAFIVFKQFPSFRRYVRWRELTAAPLLSFGEKQECAAEDLARLKGRLRQLAVADSAEFCEPVYCEFSDLAFAAAAGLASQARDGWALSFTGRVRLARLLLGALFAADDNTLLAEGSTDLATLLQRSLWPRLGVSQRTHACLLAWVYFTRYMQNPGDPALLDMCSRLIPGVLSAASPPASDNSATTEESLPWHVTCSLMHVLAEAAGTYDRTLASRERLHCVAALLALPALQESLGRGTAEKMLQLCSQNAAASAFAHMAGAVATSDEDLAERMLKLATGTSQILDDAASIWDPAAPASCVARGLHEALGRAVRPWLATVHGLDPGGGVLEALQAVAAAEAACAQKLPGQPISATSPSCARSAPEVVKIGEEAMASLVLDGTLPQEASSALLEGLKRGLLRYAEAVAAQLSCEGLVPPLPPLVRYKREVAVKAEAVDAGRTPTSRHRQHDAEEPSPAQQEADRRCAVLTPSRIGTLLNSLQYIRRQFPAWSQQSENVPDGFMDAVEAEFDRCLRRALAAVATKVVYLDLRMAAWPELHALLARAMLDGLAEALARVYLHGGANRWFIPEDAALLKDDLEQLRALFYANGEGLKKEAIDQSLAHVCGLLDIMRLDTGSIISKYQQALPADTAALSEREVLLSVLAHRADRAASKWLKKEFALPKKTGPSIGFHTLATLSRFGKARS
ncbi:hypothetical protein WJX81_006282 [Elliptochloris bilobata]|uniref:MHD2 domain-containing protein n=1 Tax=Elliptochloris bilobata TaxID=381761 RepID=A0AAW1S957_9CHLO